MAKEDKIIVEGIIVECLPNSQFKVELPEHEGLIVTATISGKIRINNIKNGIKMVINANFIMQGVWMKVIVTMVVVALLQIVYAPLVFMGQHVIYF